jgi:hypothetical protein
MSKRPTGYTIYRGPSMIDGADIVAIATLHSANGKTGDMIQTWIMRADQPPMEALKTGHDSSVCGECPLRGNGAGKQRTCYVNIGQAPRNIWLTWKAGGYPKATSRLELERIGEGRQIRLGAYGDPAAVPRAVWMSMLDYADGHTGYTHQWKTCDPNWRHVLMASTDSPAETLQAQSEGWRTFRASPRSDRLSSEKPCPSATKASKVQCIRCPQSRKCNGSGSAPSIWIETHGSGAKHHPEAS